MATKPKVEALNLVQLFDGDNTFMVPTYQREYAWGEDQVDDLTTDLTGFHESGDDFYILGQIILATNQSKNGGFRYAVVDGQQRMTTLYLLFVALDRKFTTFGISHSGPGKGAHLRASLRQVTYKSNSETLVVTQRFQATTLANKPLLQLLDDKKLSDAQIGNSGLNVKRNFDDLTSWIDRTLDTEDKLIEFTEKLLSRVFVMCVEVASEKQALAMFEKLNSRGMPLNPADLLKALIFQKSDDGDFEEINTKWEAAGIEMFQARPLRIASLQYLMQALLQPETGESVAANEIHEKWLEILDKDASRFGNTKNFSQEIFESAKILSRIASPAVNELNDKLLGSRYLKAHTHYPALLEARKLSLNNQATYGRLAAFLDARATLSSFAGEGPQYLNTTMWRWSKALREVGPDQEVEKYLSALYEEDSKIERLLKDAKDNLLVYYSYETASNRRRLRFALAYIANYIEHKNNLASANITLTELLAEGAKNPNRYDLDHIMPQVSVTKPSFDLSDGTNWVNRIGNLCLLHKQDNRRAGAVSPKEKSQDYANSKLLLTQSLALPDDSPALQSGRGVAPEGAAYLRSKGAQDVEDWNRSKSEAQGEFYFSIFEEAIRVALGR